MLYQSEEVLNLRPNGSNIYRHFNIQQFYFLPTQCIYLFCVDLKTNSHYLPIQHELTGFYDRDLTLGSPVVGTCTTWLKFDNSTFSPHCIYVFCIYLRTNSDFCILLLKLFRFYNRGRKCLHRGTVTLLI